MQEQRQRGLVRVLLKPRCPMRADERLAGGKKTNKHMAEKNSISTAAAKAVAKVKEGKAFEGKWGVGEHLACIRYLVMDAMAEAKLDAEDVKTVNEKLKEAFKANPELAYASNFQKLLISHGEIKAAAKAGDEYE